VLQVFPLSPGIIKVWDACALAVVFFAAVVVLKTAPSCNTTQICTTDLLQPTYWDIVFLAAITAVKEDTGIAGHQKIE
jgi:hypothetical protein